MLVYIETMLLEILDMNELRTGKWNRQGKIICLSQSTLNVHYDSDQLVPKQMGLGETIFSLVAMIAIPHS